MAGTVSTKIELDGGKTFAQALKDIATQAKVMDSEMRAAASAVDKEADSQKKAQQQHEVLTKRIEEQRKIVERLKAVMEDSAKQNGEDAASTQKAKIAYNDAVTALNNMEGQLKETTDQMKGYSSETSKSEKTTSGASEAFKKVASGIATAAKAIATATAAIAAAAVAAGKALYNMAQETASYGDEIEKNSQKVGLSYESYQKWDYAMQLAGTEMSACTTGLKTLTNTFDDANNGSAGAVEKFERLGLSLEDLQGLSREDVFGQVVNALQGIESETEKAALANDLFGKSGQDLLPLLNMTADELAGAMQEAEDYGMIMSDEAVTASADFQDALTKLQGALSGAKNSMMGDLLPAITLLVNGFSDLIAGNEGAAESISQGTEAILGALTEMIPNFVDLIGTIALAVLEAAPQILTSLAEGIVSALPELVTVAIDTILTLVDALLSGESIKLLLDGAVQIIEHLAQGLIDNLPQILASAEELIGELLTGLADGIPQLIDMAVKLVFSILNGLTNPDSLQKMIRGALKLVTELAKGLVQAIPQITSQLPEIISNIVSTLIELAPELIIAAVEIAGQLIVGLIGAIPQIIKVIPDIINNMKEKFTGFDWASLGKNIMDGIKNGVVNAAKQLAQTVANAAKELLNSAKRALGIHSPSKEFEKVGDFIGEGLDRGMMNSFKEASRDMQRELRTLPMNASATLTAASGSGSGRSFNFGSVNFTVNAAEGQDPRSIAREVERIFMQDLRAKEGAFA